MAELASGLVPGKPFVLLGQMTTSDATRSPPGTEAAWAYAHVPQEVHGDAGPDGITGKWDERETEAFARRMEDRIEAHAPGFRELVIGRNVMSHPSWKRPTRTSYSATSSGGTAQLHQQLVFRPIPDSDPPRRRSRASIWLGLRAPRRRRARRVRGQCGPRGAVPRSTAAPPAPALNDTARPTPGRRGRHSDHGAPTFAALAGS